jgi:hypothetical protein
MPSVHRNALNKLLAVVKRRIHEDEVKLVRAGSDEERDQLVEELADLHMRQKEIMELLVGDGEPPVATQPAFSCAVEWRA